MPRRKTTRKESDDEENARSNEQTPLYNFHSTSVAVMESIPEVVAQELSVEALALLMMAIHKHWHAAMAFAEAAACDEGCIWDAKQRKLREIGN